MRPMADPQPAPFEDELLAALEAVHRFALSLARARARVPGPSEELVGQVRRLIASHQHG